MSEHVTQVATIASKATYTAAGGTALWGGLTANEVGVVAGIVLGVATFAVNTYYQHKRFRLEADVIDRRRRDIEDG